MKSTIISLIAAAGLLAATGAFAVEMPELARKMNCTACHAIDKKVIGPPWLSVAKKYKGDATAAEKLQVKVSKGGHGVWSSMPYPMPANDAAGTKQAEIRELVTFILGLAK